MKRDDLQKAIQIEREIADLETRVAHFEGIKKLHISRYSRSLSLAVRLRQERRHDRSRLDVHRNHGRLCMRRRRVLVGI